MDEEVCDRWQVSLVGQLTGVTLFSRDSPADSVNKREAHSKLGHNSMTPSAPVRLSHMFKTRQNISDVVKVRAGVGAAE